MKILRKGLAQGTPPQYAASMDSEIWAKLPPPLESYEVSNTGRVRKWLTKYGKPGPWLYRGVAQGTTVTYLLKGRCCTIDDLMRSAFGDEADEMDCTQYDPRERDRRLSRYERNEILAAEGWKPAFEVAQDFRIDSSRVRNIWDGHE